MLQETLLRGDKFEYKKLTEAEQKQRGILGRLIGPCADFAEPTRNGRKYSEQLWENVFEDPIMKEKIANRCCFGELNHPEDRSEIDMEKVAICLAETPKKAKNGKLYGVFDILDTPNGRILKTLCDYGCHVGISSRGQGDVLTDENGDEYVDPETYNCECFDVVLIPGVEQARLNYVREGLETKKSLKAALKEDLQSADDQQRKVMKETLDMLKIDINEKKDENNESEVEEKPEVKETENDEIIEITNDEVENAEAEEQAEENEKTPEAESEEEKSENEAPVANKDENVEVENDEAKDEESEVDQEKDEDIFLNFLANNFDEDKVREVCKILKIEIEGEENNDESNAEKSAEDIEKSDDEPAEVENEVEEAKDNGSDILLSNLKEAVKRNDELENAIKDLQEKLAVSDAKVNESIEECSRYKTSVARLSSLVKEGNQVKEKVSELERSLESQTLDIENQKARIFRLVLENRKLQNNNNNSEKLNETLKTKDNELNSLNEKLVSTKSNYEEQIKKLNEKLEFNVKENEAKMSKLTENLNKESAIKESYKKLATKAVNKYIDIKAETLGLTSTDIKRKLGESYTLSDVDQVCRDLRSYQLNVSRLPFSIDRNVKVRVNESNTSTQNVQKVRNVDDDVDDTLIKLANVK